MFDYISEQDLRKYTKEVLDKVQFAYQKVEIKLHSNILDPFSALFDSMRQGISFEDWLGLEKSRQVQKTLQNAVGDFHQNILGSVDGWENPGRGGGYDLINRDRKILAEIKNKHNTMNSSSAESTYRKLESYLKNDYKGYTSYVVFVVPKYPVDFNSTWSPNSKTMKLRKGIRKIDGESFYSLVTGDKNALKNLYNALPRIISEILGTNDLSATEALLFKELFQRAYK